MSATIFEDLNRQINVQRDRYEQTGECDSAFIATARASLARAMRIMDGLPGSEVDMGHVTNVKASGVAKSAMKGTWRSPKALDDATNYVILDSIRTATRKNIYLPREKHLDVIEAFYPELNRASIPPKLGEWQGAGLVTWKPRKPATIILGVNGLEKLRSFYPAAREKKDAISEAMRTLDEGYIFPDLNDLAG